jgi:hypothetical protein
MIIVSEVAHPGEIHLEVNSSLLQIITDIHPNELIVFRAETEHTSAVSSYFKHSSNIQIITFDKYYDPKTFSWPARIIGEMKEIYRSLKTGRKLNAGTYLWTCIFPTGHFFLSLYLAVFGNRRVKHIIVLHGELEFLRDGKTKVDYFLGLALKWAIKLSRRNTTYIVLGDRIKDHLKAYFPERILKRVTPILHPYHYNSDSAVTDFRSDLKPIVFGAIGTQMLSKNSNYIFDLAQGLQNEIVGGDFTFATVGKVLPELFPYKNKLVTQLYPDSFVPQSIFEAEAKKLNFVLFFYNNDSYKLCPSGAIFEVIKLGLPVISIHNDYFDWLFEKYGHMGFLCNNLDEMSLLIKNIRDGSLEPEINRILKTIQKFKKENDLKSIAVDLAGKI